MINIKFGEDLLEIKQEHYLNVLLNEEIELPISVGIFSSWGTGKTFLLKKREHQINELTKRDLSKKFVLVNFNAWEYSGADLLMGWIS